MTGARGPAGGYRNVWLGEPAEDETPVHICGQCRTPSGKSTVPCRNEFPEFYERARRVAAYKAATEGQQQ